MAKESINLLGTSEITERDEGNSRRHTTGEPISLESEQSILPHYRRASISSSHDRNKSRRNSMGKFSSPNSGNNIVPHYLRASTGSCHDFCKYGRRHAFEAQATPPIPKRITPTASDMQNPIRTVVPMEMKKKTVVKLKPSPVLKTQSPDPPEIIKQEVSIPPKQVEVSSKQDSLNDKKMTEKERKMNLSAKRVPSVKPKPAAVKPSSSSDTSAGINGRQNRNIGNGKKTVTSKAPVKKVVAPPTAPLSPNPPVNRVVSLNTRKDRSLKLVSPLKDQNKIQKAKPKLRNNNKVQEKTLHVIKTESEDKILESVQTGDVYQLPSSLPVKLPEPSSHPNSPSLSSYEEEDKEESEYSDSETDDFISENYDVISTNEVETSKGNHNKTRREGEVVLPEDKDCTPVKLKFRRGKVVDLHSENNGPRRLRFRRGRVLGENQDSRGDIRRRNFKKRGVDDTNGTKSNSEKVVLSHEEDKEESEYSDSETDDFISENDDVISTNEVETSKGNHNRTRTEGEVVLPEDKDCTPVKLKFRRGKVVDLHSENNGPRRLRFRRGRVLGENQDSRVDIRRRNFKKRGVDDTNGTKSNSEKVVLRHQDMEGKKDAQGLFNNVIEETASKLVESRKSKVKALVGAFETVISLQE